MSGTRGPSGGVIGKRRPYFCAGILCRGGSAPPPSSGGAGLRAAGAALPARRRSPGGAASAVSSGTDEFFGELLRRGPGAAQAERPKRSRPGLQRSDLARRAGQPGQLRQRVGDGHRRTGCLAGDALQARLCAPQQTQIGGQAGQIVGQPQICLLYTSLRLCRGFSVWPGPDGETTAKPQGPL